MFCPHCGTRLAEETNNFCPRCGGRLAHAAEPLFPAPQPFIDPDDSAAMEAVVREEPAMAVVPPLVPVAPHPTTAAVAASHLATPAAVVAPVTSLRRSMDRATAVLAIVGCMLLLATWVMVWLAPLVDAPYVADAGGPLMTVVAQLDPALAASIDMGADGRQNGLYTLNDLVAEGLFYGETLGAANGGTMVTALTLAFLGVVAVAVALGCAGLLFFAVRRYPSRMLVTATIVLFALLAVGVGAVCVVDVLWVPDVRAVATALFAGEGPQVSIPVHVLLPTSFLLIALAMATVSAILLLVARRRWSTERAYL